MKKVLALDVAFTAIGWAVIVPTKSKDTVLAVGTVKNPADPKRKKKNIRASSATAERIAHLYRGLQQVYLEHNPSCIIAELPGGGGKSSISVKGMAMGSAVTVALVTQYAVSAEWTTQDAGKLALCGSKDASKLQMQQKAIDKFPELRNMVPVSKRAATGYEAWFEHSADAIAAFLAAREGALVRYIAEDNNEVDPDPCLF